MPPRGTERWLAALARWGLVSIAVSFAIVALISIKVAITGSGHPQGREGALSAVAREPFGKVLLVVVAIGFVGYAAWRLTTAVIGETIEDDKHEKPLKRVGDALRGLFYLAFAGACVKFVVSAGGSQTAGGQKERQATAVLLGLPGGRLIVGAIGLCVMSAGLYNGYRAVSGKYRDRLKTWQMDDEEERIVTPIAVAGLFARMIVFGLVGAFLLASAIRYDPKEAVGLDGALQRLVTATYGRPLLGVVAAGLLCYALFRLTEARYRRV